MRSPRVLKLAPGEKRSAWARALADPSWRDNATLLKRDKDTAVWRTHMLGNDVVVKCWSLNRLKRRLQAITNTTPALRQWAGAAWLAEHGFPTASNFALVRVRLDNTPCDCLAIQMLSGTSVLEHLRLGDLSTRQEHQLAQALGDQIRALIDLNKYNRDHKPSNLIVSFDREDNVQVSIIDTVAIRRCSLTWDDLCDMLADLLIEPTGCGCPPRQSLMLRAALAAIGIDDATRRAHRSAVQKEVRDAWRWVLDEIEGRGNLTPKIDPLAHIHRKDG